MECMLMLVICLFGFFLFRTAVDVIVEVRPSRALSLIVLAGQSVKTEEVERTV